MRVLRDASAVASLVHLEESGLFGAFDYDIAASTMLCSAEMLRRHGVDPAQPVLRFEDLWQRILPGDRDRVSKAAAEGLAAGSFATVYRVQMPGQPLRWMQAAAHLMRSPQGAPQRWIGIVLDASSTLVAETLQQESHAQVAELVESIEESFVALDHDFRFTYVNQRVCDKAGRSREELIGQSMWELFPEAAASEFHAGYRKVAEERRRSSFMVSYSQPDGSHSWFEAHAFPTAEGIAALVRDVTDLKAAREALEASEERFRRAQQAANIGAFEWDLATNRIAWAAKVPTFTDVADTDDFSGYLRYVNDADRQEVMATIARIAGGGQHSIEVRVHPPDGRTLWFYFRAEAVFSPGGQPTRIYGIAMDVTDRKRAEEALRTSEKLAATGRLAATIAHEINNPLEAVTNLLFLARTSGAGQESQDYLKRAEEELQRVAMIVRQTLGFYRGSSTPSTVDLTQLLDETLVLFEKRLSSRSIVLERNAEAPVRVVAIEGEVRQIVANLVANAIDAVEPGGHVWLHLQRQAGCARLVVRDGGRGISTENMQRLFEPFFTTRQGAGTGLGLWVSRELARKNGGAIQCSSPGEGLGATFELTLPLA